MDGLSQLDLFGDALAPLPEGMRYEAGFLSADEERELLDVISRLPLERMNYKGHQALRRVISYGGAYDFSAGRLEATEPIPAWLEPLRERIAAWAQRPAREFTQALVAEYAPGTPLGWHRDVPEFEDIVGVSLRDEAVMRFRPWPQNPAQASVKRKPEELRLRLAPRSIYLLRGPGRWAWQHSVLPTRALRYSITFRMARRSESRTPS